MVVTETARKRWIIEVLAKLEEFILVSLPALYPVNADKSVEELDISVPLRFLEEAAYL
jgi:hypothetical protein